jgi:hypothetical protein
MQVSDVMTETGLSEAAVRLALSNVSNPAACDSLVVEPALDCDCCHGVYAVGPRGRVLVGGAW